MLEFVVIGVVVWEKLASGWRSCIAWDKDNDGKEREEKKEMKLKMMMMIIERLE